MAGYDPKGKRARSTDPGRGGAVPMDAMLNATGEHAAVKVDPTPTPPEGVDVSDLESASLPPKASREGKRNTESTETVQVSPTDVEPVDQAAAADPTDPTPPEAPLLGDSETSPGDASVESTDLPSAPARREPLVPAAAPPDEQDRRLLIASLVALILALLGGGVIAWRRRTN